MRILYYSILCIYSMRLYYVILGYFKIRGGFSCWGEVFWSAIGFRVLGLEVRGSASWDHGSGLRVKGLGGLGFRGFRV